MTTYTESLGLELPDTGDRAGTWGEMTNTNMKIIDRGVAGVKAITLSSTPHALTTTDGNLSDGQYKVLVLGGSPSGTNTITVAPNDTKRMYFVKNNSGQSAIFSQGSGANVTVANGASAIIYCDGAGSGAAVVDIGAALPLSGALLAANNLSDVANASTARTNLGVAIGSNVLAYDANLQSFVTALTLPTSDGTNGQALVTNGSGTISFGSAGIGTGKAIAMAIVFG